MMARPGIPAIPPTDAAQRAVLLAMKENIELSNGVHGWERQSVTLGMLVKLGVITATQAKAVAKET